jgi:hypothetical protein
MAVPMRRPRLSAGAGARRAQCVARNVGFDERRQITNKNKMRSLSSRMATIRDYFRVLRSGVFMHSAYSRHYFSHSYLKPKIFAFLALPHYLVAGEARGYLPNPFFEPSFFDRHAPGKRLVDYLRDPALWQIPTSNYFDPHWYVRTHGRNVLADQSPLENFWKKGFDAGLNPAERFDTLFFRRAIARDTRDKKDFAYRYLSEVDPAAPLNAIELADVQKRFYDSINLEVLKYSEVPTSDFLLFIQAGRNFPTRIFKDAPFDVLVNFYEHPSPTDAHYLFHQPGTKITAIRKIMERFPELLLKYRAVLFLDDDVELSPAQIERLFETHASHGVDLMQASLSATSSCFYPTLKQPMAGRGLRYLTGIEIMMPLISRRALQACGWVFNEGISGWGIDILLSAEVKRKFGNTIALLGDVIAIHRRSTDTKNNDFYRFLSRHGINPTVEAGHITLKFGLKESPGFIHFGERVV